MTAPDYDTAVVAVTPQLLWDLGAAVESSRTRLLEHVQNIFNALNALTTGWNSDSASEAEAFAKQIGAAFDDVFGSDGSDRTGGSNAAVAGVLNEYKNFLQAAAAGFDTTETQLVKQWNSYNDGLTGTGGSAPAGNGAITDATQTAVSYDTVGR